MGDWLGWDHQFFGFGLRGLSRLHRLFDLITGACLGPTVTLDADFAVTTINNSWWLSLQSMWEFQ
jgi:hypothetical protein